MNHGTGGLFCIIYDHMDLNTYNYSRSNVRESLS